MKKLHKVLKNEV